MADRRSIVVATGNPHKWREILEVMADLPVSWSSLNDHPPMPAPFEDEDTFEANAVKKALHYAARTGLWVLADDSGLEVDALDGAPGVRSARYAGPAQDSAANNARLIAALVGVPPRARTARFRCAIALAQDLSILADASGAVEGLIVDQPRGHAGFGYDPYFYVREYGMTMAEMTPKLKNCISHRGAALRSLRPKLEALLIGQS